MAIAPLTKLKLIAPADIGPNPENPRLIFRQDEMESLMLSIDKHGIQVPLTVYQEGNSYTLLDGERRWRCAKKLNLKVVPAIVQEKPTELQNLVLMYNIHALREQWDYYTIASKLERVISLYGEEHGSPPNEVTLSELTGLTRGAIRRCQLLIDLPDRFKTMLVSELEKPKSQQRLTEDFFLEMQKALKAVTRRLPEYESRIDDIRDTLVKKFRERTISAVTDFRQLSKIATAVDSLGVAHQEAKRALDKVFNPTSKVTIREAYEGTVQFEYDERKATRHVATLLDFLEEVESEEREESLDDDFLASLTRLYERLRAVLGIK
jgi:ParB family chromosome partitioning protein